MEKKILEDSSSEIFHFNIICLGDYSYFIGTTIAQSLLHFTG